MKFNNLLSKFISALNIVALFLFLIYPSLLNAASLTAISDTMTEQKASTASVHVIRFTSTSAIALGNTIALAFPAGFTTTSLAITELQICHGTNGTEYGTPVITGGTACGAQPETIAATNGTNIWGAVISGTTTITLTAPSTFTNTITAGQKVTITIAAVHMINPTLSTPAVTITTTSDTGTFTVPIVDDDMVTVSATVNETITFDLDTATSNTDTNSPYTVALSTLSTGAVTGSNESGVNSIWIDLATNAGGGAIVTVKSTNGSLKSTSVTGDTIPSATATMAAGTANYGICVKLNTATTGTLTKVAPFNGATCTTTPAGNTVGAVTTSTQNIFTSNSLPIAGGRGEIMVDAAISATTPAHTDYGDTLSLLATGTF